MHEIGEQLHRSLYALVSVFVIGLITSCAATLPEVQFLGPWQEVTSLTTRPGVTIRVLQMIPTAPVKGIFLFLPGGNGVQIDSRGRALGMFLPRRSRQIVEQGYVSAALDVPSDQAYGITNRFRISKQHLEDITKALDFLSSKYAGPIFIIGISRGTLSAAHVGTSANYPRIKGIVLASSMVDRMPGLNNDVSLFDLPLEKIFLPILLVHHRSDECSNTSFNEALRLPQRMTGSPNITFVEVLGGDPPQSAPCLLLSAHGFLGKEREVITAVIDWASGKKVTNRIGP